MHTHARTTIGFARTGRIHGFIRFAVGRIVLVVVARRLVGFGGFPRTLLAASMLALCAGLLAGEVGFAAMALAVDTLPDRLANEVLAASLAGDGDAVRDIALALLVANLCVGLGLRERCLGCLFALVLRLFGTAIAPSVAILMDPNRQGNIREAGAFLATLVVAFTAFLVGTEGGVAFVTSAVDTHADFLVLTFAGGNVANRPILGAEFDTVLLEQSLGTLGSGDGSGRSSGRFLRLLLASTTIVS
jgi:hypothetical protein